ncbi:MAG TPA: efflux RND transporter periplasmic adaptor subunit [Thermoanaerobaculia bacterium]|nr:efflux RND transporter periplasmic adaptor subunit [Thermoanaerobaculia bacterium]
MKRQHVMIAVITIVALGVAAILWARQRDKSSRDLELRFVTIETGDLRRTVSATGTLHAVKTVSVGTQVSGKVEAILVDFNDQVKKGQLLARIDPTLARQTVTDAQASVERSNADLVAAKRDYSRTNQLVSQGLSAKSAFDTVEASLAIASANVKSARVGLDRARQNLSYTSILAPTDGVVVERNVSEGQTVAASLSAPQLFLLANDLARMQILVQVDESDIASIKEEQPVSFSVQALPRETFTGTVQQVRLQSKTQDNIVSYTVVIEVENLDRKLLPGMTANVEFLVGSASDVLKVANAALRFRPSAELITKLGGDSAAMATSPRSSGAPSEGNGPGGRNWRSSDRSGQPRGNRPPGQSVMERGRLFYLDEAGKLQAVRVRIGITDGAMTEISGKNVTPGLKVLAGTLSSASTTSTSGSSPFGNPAAGGQGRGGGGPRGSF